MEEKIIKPNWLKSCKYMKYSHNINKFMVTYKLDDMDNVNLNLLRHYYKKDKESFLELIDELVLRGFKFNVKKETPLLPNIAIESDNKVILLCEDKNRYKNINFDRLNISNFINRFKVESDYFFNYIKIDYFLYLNRNINLSILNEEFEKVQMLDLYDEKECDINCKHDNQKIDVVFNDSGFVLFLNYCKKNNITYLSDLEGFDFNKLYSVDRLGEGKIKKIINRYNEILDKNIEQDIIEIDEPELISINNDFKEININSLFTFGISPKTIDILKNDCSINYLRDLEQYTISDFRAIRGIGKSKIDEFENIILILNNNAERLYMDAFKGIKKDKNFDIYRMRCKNKYTLEEIGNVKGCTRERIRQQEKLIIQRFESYFDTFGSYFKGILNNSNCITIEDIGVLFPEYEDVMLIKYALKNEAFKEFIYIDEINKFINRNIVKKLEEILLEIKDNIPMVFKIEEIDNINDILNNKGLDFIDEDDIVGYLTNYGGYKKLNDYLWKGRETLGKIYSYVIKEHYPKGVNIYTDEIKELTLKVKEEFGIVDNRESRAIASRIIDETVLCDRGKYIHPDYIQISKELLNEIKDYIDNNGEEHITLVQLFSLFENKLMKMSNLHNRYFLHGVIKYYYKDEYTFTRDTISKNGKAISSNKILEEFLKEKYIAVNVKELKERFNGWTQVMFANAPNVNDNILLWDFGTYIHRDNIHVSDEELTQLKIIIDGQLSGDVTYININSIYNKMKLKMRALFKNNNIENSNNLFYLLYAVLKNEYVFKRNIIYKKGMNEEEYVNAFEKYINEKDVINYEEYMDHFRCKKFKESTIYAGFKRQTKKLVQISLSEYVKYDKLNLTNEIINKVKEVILKELSTFKYIPVFDITDYNYLPDIGYEWSPYLITELVNKHISDLKIIESDFKDRRYRRPVIVRNDSDMVDIVDIIIYSIKYEYNDPENLIISKVKDYLINRNIITQSIPNEFYESDKILIDEYGRISIVEV